MKASKLLKYLKNLEAQGWNLNRIDVYYRYDGDTDEESVKHVCEDLFDPSDNSTPISIMLSTRVW